MNKITTFEDFYASILLSEALDSHADHRMTKQYCRWEIPEFPGSIHEHTYFPAPSQFLTPITIMYSVNHIQFSEKAGRKIAEKFGAVLQENPYDTGLWFLVWNDNNNDNAFRLACEYVWATREQSRRVFNEWSSSENIKGLWKDLEKEILNIIK